MPGRISRGQIFVLGVSLLGGIVIALALPLGAGFDEEQHMRRVWEMSALKFIPNSSLGPDMPVPASFSELSYRRSPIIRPLTAEQRSETRELKTDELGWIYDDTATRSVYSPITLLPQSVVFRYMISKYDMPLASTVAVARTAGLVAYLTLVYIAVRLVPYGKWTLIVLASAPTAVFQASTISADGVANGLGLVFIAGTLALAAMDKIGWKELGWQLLLVAGLFSAKINMAPLALLPLLILRPSKLRMRGGQMFLISATAALALVEVVAWNVLAAQNSNQAFADRDPLGQVIELVTYPFQFLTGVMQDISLGGIDTIRGWIGAYGYFYWEVPRITYVLFAIALILSLVSTAGRLGPSRRIRVNLVGVGIATYLATVLLRLVFGDLTGSLEGHALQGRYLTVVAPLLFLALVGLPVRWPTDVAIWPIPAAAVASLLTFAAGLYLSYHVTCGTAYYNPGLCYQPQYKNWAPDDRFSPPISSKFNLQQELIAECGGMTQVRIWVNSMDIDVESYLEISLQEASSGALVDREKLSSSSLPDRGWAVLDFNPLENSLGTRYILNIAGPAGGSGRNPRVSYTLKPEYDLGILYESGEEVTYDLFFQYGCATGISELLGRAGR